MRWRGWPWRAGLLLLTLTNRFGRMLDRSRSIIREVSEGGQSPAAVSNLNDQVEILHRRARILAYCWVWLTP